MIKIEDIEVDEDAPSPGPIVIGEGVGTDPELGAWRRSVIGEPEVASIRSSHRGHPTHFVAIDGHKDGGVWRFDADGAPVPSDPDRPCGFCNLPNREDGHDACLGKLPNVMNACCGHGGSSRPYVQFQDGTVLDGAAALDLIARIKGIRP